MDDEVTSTPQVGESHLPCVHQASIHAISAAVPAEADNYPKWASDSPVKLQERNKYTNISASSPASSASSKSKHSGASGAVSPVSPDFLGTRHKYQSPLVHRRLPYWGNMRPWIPLAKPHDIRMMNNAYRGTSLLTSTQDCVGTYAIIPSGPVGFDARYCLGFVEPSEESKARREALRYRGSHQSGFRSRSGQQVQQRDQRQRREHNDEQEYEQQHKARNRRPSETPALQQGDYYRPDYTRQTQRERAQPRYRSRSRSQSPRREKYDTRYYRDRELSAREEVRDRVHRHSTAETAAPKRLDHYDNSTYRELQAEIAARQLELQQPYNADFMRRALQVNDIAYIGTITTRRRVESMEDLKLFARRYEISPQVIKEGNRENLIELIAEKYARVRVKEYAGQTLEQFAAGHIVQPVNTKTTRPMKLLKVMNGDDKGIQDVFDSLSKAKMIARKIEMQNQSSSAMDGEPLVVDPRRSKNSTTTKPVAFSAITKTADSTAQSRDQTTEKPLGLKRNAGKHDHDSPDVEDMNHRPSSLGSDSTVETSSETLDHPRKKKRVLINGCNEPAGRRKQRDSAVPKSSQSPSASSTASTNGQNKAERFTLWSRKTDGSDDTDECHDSGDNEHQGGNNLRQKGSKASAARKEQYLTALQFKKKYFKW